MSEGELYKKIIKKRRVNYLANKSIKEVIEDAKKEFPSVEQLTELEKITKKFALKQELTSDEKTALILGIGLMRNRILKWFGDKEK